MAWRLLALLLPLLGVGLGHCPPTAMKAEREAVRPPPAPRVATDGAAATPPRAPTVANPIVVRTVILDVGPPPPLPPGAEPPDLPRPKPAPPAPPMTVSAASLARRAFLPRPDRPALDPDRSLVALRRHTWVRARPSFRSRRIGYLSTGAVVGRSKKPAGHERCKGGWYRIEPRGYVCVGTTATLDVAHPLALAAAVAPDRRRPLPYVYGKSRYPAPHFFTKVPTEAERRSVVGGKILARRARGWKAWDGTPFEPLPAFLAGERRVPRADGSATPGLHSGSALTDSSFAFIHLFEVDGRRFGVSRDMAVMPLDRLTPVRASSFRGVELRGVPHAAFVKHSGAFEYRKKPSGTLAPHRRLRRREGVLLSGESRRYGGRRYLATRDGGWIVDDGLVKVRPMRRRPGWARGTRRWIDVSILHQRLVAYEGTRPVFATLVSTGADGLGDPKETHSTVQGTFLIHTKHVTATMDSDEEGDAFDIRDVPYVQYFQDGYALHAAYWHDAFGIPRSHGCINLAPRDARWLFAWTGPEVPPGWHGALSLKNGTLVHVHP